MDKKYLEHFTRWNCLLVVIHSEEAGQVIRNAERTFENGADGIFLIDHSSHSSDNLLDFYRAAREIFPLEWIGLNFLGSRGDSALEFLPIDADGLWTDNASIHEGQEFQHFADMFRTRLLLDFPDTLYFGGVAFKGQRAVSNLHMAAQKAKPLMDVVTTSGLSTGVKPDVSKIQIMRDAIGPETPLAIASGISADNINSYRNFANCFVVSSSLCVPGSFTELDGNAIFRLSEIINSWN